MARLIDKFGLCIWGVRFGAYLCLVLIEFEEKRNEREKLGHEEEEEEEEEKEKWESRKGSSKPCVDSPLEVRALYIPKF